MHDQVGVSADRAGEVRVMFAGQCEVADGRGGIFRLAQGLQHSQVDRMFRGLATHFFEQLLQFPPTWPLRNVVARHARELAQRPTSYASGSG